MNELQLKELTPELPIILTEPEAAKLLKISHITLKRIRLRGEIGFSRIGGSRVVYTEQHVLEYLKIRERKDIRNN